MAAYHKEWARRQRRLLLFVLGGRCAKCGALENMEFDCIRALGDKHHKHDTSQRMSFYRQQFRAGNVQVLCQECNGRKGNGESRKVEGRRQKGRRTEISSPAGSVRGGYPGQARSWRSPLNDHGSAVNGQPEPVPTDRNGADKRAGEVCFA